MKLTLREFQVLSCLVQAHPKGMAPGLIRTSVWGNLKVVPKALDVHLFKIRRKLESIGWGIRYENECYVLARTQK